MMRCANGAQKYLRLTSPWEARRVPGSMKPVFLDPTDREVIKQDAPVLLLSVVVVFIGLLLIGSPGVVV